MTKEFKVASVSLYYNNFGLRGMILIARDGESWEVAANDINVKQPRTVLKVPYLHRPTWAGLGFEIPNRLRPDAPPEIVKEVWENTEFVY